MSYGFAITCDYCNKITAAPAPIVVNEYEDGGAAEGFIRLSINRPPDSPWGGGVSAMVEAFDACSISCARNILYNAGTMLAETQDPSA
jgi:hypothetical protein